jgi:hypothetical protein
MTSKIPAVKEGYVKVFIDDKPYDLKYIIRCNAYIQCPICKCFLQKDYFPIHFEKKHKKRAWFY